MDSIEKQRGHQPSHGLLKFAVIYMFMQTFLNFTQKSSHDHLETQGYSDAAHVLQLGIRIFLTCSALLAQYIVEYHRQCKSLVAMGLLIALPVFILDSYIQEIQPYSEVSYQQKNTILIYCAGTSLLEGIGLGLYQIGALSYVAINSSKGQSGKNFGFFISITSLSDFFAIELTKNDLQI